MNAITASGPSYGFGRKLLWLIRREWWEHRGSFFTGPVIAGGIFLILTLLMLIIGQVLFNKNKPLDGAVKINNLDLAKLDQNTLAQMSPEHLQSYADAINVSLLLAGTWPLVIFGFAVFFYLLGALYDERRDRSILLWKSLPLSDTQTVLSKLVTALLVAPLSASLVALVTALGFGLLISLFILINGGNPLTLFWAHLSPLQLAGGLFAWIPIYMLWALPTVGWLLLCSAWARSAPFLWSLLVPILSGIAISMFSTLGYSSSWYWQHIVWRLIASAWPGSHWLGYIGNLEGSPSIWQGLPLSAINSELWFGYPLLTRPTLWLGAVAGIAMILIAIRLRRWRSEA
ncbi:hypothetical protein CO615_06965 [Lysobacteraceae bacterium NML75-0749]|nr:hypothetical protein CO615_06965 [Xanthomonadaceae bacterium NML75-0749]PJK05923.1 hypothetical protein CO609_03075 [Xanthomonadaceae bacterium NML91-0268]